MSAREALGTWASVNVSDEDRPMFSKLVAAYVAECVRMDREKRAPSAADEANAKKAFEESQRRVNAINGKPDLRDLFRSGIFGGGLK